MRHLRSPDILIFAVLLAALGLLLSVTSGFADLSLWLQLLWAAVVVAVSLEASELIAAALVCPCDLPQVDALKHSPPVAVLFLVCDDLVLAALARLGITLYPNAEIFILDDSKSRETRDRVDAAGFNVVRRDDRHGYKAGSLNNWLRLYATNYDYFVVLDSDSIVAAEFLDTIVRYAEHPVRR
jgi:Glycosyl transferase family 2